MRIEVVYAITTQAWSANIDCEDGCTVAEVIEVASALETFENVPIKDGDGCSVWGKVVERSYVLSDGDRVEVLRSLKHDPMHLRRINATR